MKAPVTLNLHQLRSIILLVLFLHSGVSVVGQTEVKTITLDFREKVFSDLSSLEGLSNNTYYRLEVKNFNSSLYKVSINAKDSTISEPMTIPTWAGFSLDNLTKLTAAVSASSTAVGAKAAPAGIVNPYVANAKKILRENETKLQTNADVFVTIKFSIDNLLHAYNKYQYTALLENQAQSVIDVKDLSLTSLLNDLAARRAELEALYKTVLQHNDDFIKDVNDPNVAAAIEANKEMKEIRAALTAAITELTVSVVKAREAMSAENAMKIVAPVISALNNSSFSYLSLPFQFSREQTTLKISITPHDPKSALQSYETTFTFPATRSDRFWGISTGFYVSGLHDEAYSPRSSYNAELDSTTYRLVKEEPGKTEFGLNALVHYGWGISNSATFVHLAFGPAISVSDKVRPRLFIGGGLALGKKHKFLLTGGLAIGNVNVLSKAHTLEDEYGTRPDNVTVSRLKYNGFVSVGYLFFK